MSDETIKQANNALEEFGEKFAEMVRFTQELFKKMTPEQRAVVDFLAKNPKVAEAFQELNQKLARQRAIEGATKEAAQPKEPLIKDEKMRKAVRAWAKMNDIEEVDVEPPTVDVAITSFAHGLIRIDFFQDRLDISEAAYTITELCGEEKE